MCVLVNTRGSNFRVQVEHVDTAAGERLSAAAEVCCELVTRVIVRDINTQVDVVFAHDAVTVTDELRARSHDIHTHVIFARKFV